MSHGKAVLRRFPITRPPLPRKYLDIYEVFYKNNRQGKSLATAVSLTMEKWMHRKVSRYQAKENARILEIGAGTLNHVPFESNFSAYDIVEPFADLYRESVNLDKIRNIYRNIEDVPLNQKYDKIVSIAAFEHILDLPDVISRAELLLETGGRLCLAIPSEGTVLWRIACLFTTGLEFRLTYGLNHKTLMKYEHVNSSFEIREIVELYFKIVKSEFFGFCPSVSLYQYYECMNHHRDAERTTSDGCKGPEPGLPARRASSSTR